MIKPSSSQNKSNSRGSKAQQAQKAQEREKKKLRQKIKYLKEATENSSILSDMPTKGLGIILGDISEDLSNIIDHQSENKVEMEYSGKVLENLWYYLNFYRESNQLVERLRKTAKSFMQQGNNKVKVTAFRVEKEEDNRKILNIFYSREEVFYTTDILEIFDLERLLFIESSRHLLEYGNINKHFKTAKGLRFISKFLTLKAWILKNFDKQEFNKFLVAGSTILFSFGIRIPNNNDIDIYIENSLKDQKNKSYPFDESFIRRFKKKKRSAPKNFFKSIDIALEGCDKCREYHTICDFHTKWPETFGANNIHEVINKQKFHYFFLGLKCVSFHGIIERQSRRYRPKPYTDLLYMRTQKRLLNLLPDKTWDTHISRLPKGEKYYRQDSRHETSEFDDDKCDELYRQIQKNLKRVYKYDMEFEEIKEIISNARFIPQINVDKDCKTMQILRDKSEQDTKKDISDDICFECPWKTLHIESD
ncbi:MAG: hypothetical protein AB4372_35130 [Xenococcus sp. (in: cyanobacteria)]